jgi:hypothetical protein
MASIIISNQTTFGSMTNNAVGRIISLQTTMQRLKDAVETASSGYAGVPGTEFEGMAFGGPGGNNFGVQPDPETPGAKGTDYAYALNQLTAQWDAFWLLARPYVEQLDNGTASM